MNKLKVENGYYIFNLENILKTKNISLNKLMKETNTDFKVLKRLQTGDLVRIDIFVIARLCDYLNCSMNDIIDYIPNWKHIPSYMFFS